MPITVLYITFPPELCLRTFFLKAMRILELPSLANRASFGGKLSLTEHRQSEKPLITGRKMSPFLGNLSSATL